MGSQDQDGIHGTVHQHEDTTADEFVKRKFVMKYGHYSDNDLKTFEQWPFRCPSWDPMPDGKKNVVILGCSHTWGVGLDPHETWAHIVSKHNTKQLRYWNLGQPGASPEACVRILYSCEKVINPKIIIVCWPEISRRERLTNSQALNLMGTDKKLRYEDNETDVNNFLKSVFFLEKYAEKNHCETFHCFADSYMDFRDENLKPRLLETHTLTNCWPYWDKFNARDRHEPSRARDGIHCGIDNHKRFAVLFLERFGGKLK